MAWVKTVKGRHYGCYRDAENRERTAKPSTACPATTGKCAKAKCAGYREAQRLADEAEKAVQQGTWTDPTKTRRSLRDFIEIVYWPTTDVLMPSTRVGYRQRIDGVFLPALGDRPLGSLTHTVIQRWVNDMERGVGPSCPTGKPKTPANIATIMAIFRAIMQVAVSERAIPSDPTAKVRLPTKAPRQVLILDEGTDRFEAAVAELDVRWQLMVLMLMETAARFSEVRGLRPRHIDRATCRVTIQDTVMDAPKAMLDAEFEHPKEGWVRISDRWYVKPFTKNGVPTPRPVAIDPRVMAMLSQYIDDASLGPDDLLFTTLTRAKKDGARQPVPVESENFRRDVWNPTLEKAELSVKLTPHKLRHTAASIALANGATQEAVQKMLGHSSVRTTQDFYVTTTDAAVDEVAAARARGKARRLTNEDAPTSR